MVHLSWRCIVCGKRRFYNPTTGRFNNADGLMGQQGNILGHNIYAYTQNNPVMYVDPNGEFALTIPIIGVTIAVTLSVVLWTTVAVLALTTGAIASLIDAGVLDAPQAPDLGRLSEITRDDIKGGLRTLTVGLSLAIADEIQKRNNGAYVVTYEDGSIYVGKGGPARMYASAIFRGLLHQQKPTSLHFQWCQDDRSAYKMEYMLMVDYGYYTGNKKFYNMIWSPGRKYYYQDNNGNLYGDDVWGR